MHELPVTVYTQESALKRPWVLLGSIFSGLVKGHHLALQFAIRDLRAQYRQAALGLLWAFIVPLATAVTWLLLRGAGVVEFADTAVPYPVYVFSGVILWAIFMDAVNAPLRQTNESREMLAKINFPREALVLSAVYQAGFNALIKAMVLLVALLLLGVYPSASLLLFPLAVLALILFGTAMGLLVTPLGTLYGDVGKALPVLLQFLMFLSPVLFPMPRQGWAVTVFELNPLTPLITTARAWVTGQPVEHLNTFLLVALVSLPLLLLALVVYRAAMPILIERMSA